MEHLGLISILVTWAGLLFLVRKWKGDRSMTFSQHAARYKTSRMYYAALFLAILPPFYWFMVHPFADRLSLGLSFKVIISMTTFSMLVAALVAEQGEMSRKIHRIAAFSMTWLLLPSVAFILFASISTFERIFVGLALALMTYGAVVLIKHKLKTPKILLGQIYYVGLFHLSILVAYYL